MTDPLHIVCPHCHTTNRVRQADLTQAPDCGSCHKPLFVAHSVAELQQWLLPLCGGHLRQHLLRRFGWRGRRGYYQYSGKPRWWRHWRRSFLQHHAEQRW